MRNNNQAVVKKIALKSLSANKGRNTFIILAIFLTTFMLGTVISLSMSYMETKTAHTIRLMGTTAHVVLNNISGSQIEKIKTLDYVSVCTYGIVTGTVQEGGYLNGSSVILEWCEPAEWETFRKPVISNIFGSYPQNIDDIMLPTWLLTNMGITEPKLGMDIELTYQTGTEQPQTRVFKLSGYFTSYALLRFGGVESIFVSQEFAGESEYRRARIQYVKNNPEYNKRIITDAQIDMRVTIINEYYINFNDELDPLIIVYAVIAVFLVIAGFLLIYNVMMISVSRDIRFYGLLKTIGMTPRQIRSMVLQQILRLCAVGIPLGLVFSALISLVVVPWFINSTTTDVIRFGGAVLSFNPVIYIGAALFALMTALFGAFKPAEKAADISPIEAVRFSEQEYSREFTRSSAFNPMKIAWRNVFRVPERAVLVFCGLFIGMTMFLLIGVVIGGADMDVYMESAKPNIDGDIYLINRMPDYVQFDDSNFNNLQAFTPEFMMRLNSLPGLTEITTRYIYPVKVDIGIKDIQSNVHYIKGEVFGLNQEETIKLNEEIYPSFDAAAFERGEFILLKNKLPISPSEMEDVNVFFMNTDEPVSLKIGGYLKSASSGAFGTSLEIYMSDNLLQELAVEPVILSIDLYIALAEQKQAFNLIKEWSNSHQYIQWHSGIEVREEVEQQVAILMITGSSISAILCLIGILNFINIITTSILSRRHELALLESIGQSPNQSKKMLMCEGFIYAAVTLLLVCVIGGALIHGLVLLLSSQYDYFVFNIPYIQLSVMVCIVLLVCLSVPRLTYRVITKMTLVERLREVE